MNTACVIQCNHVGWEGTTDVSLRKDLHGRLVIEEVVSRALRVKGVDGRVVLACPDLPENRVFGEVASKYNCKIYYGSNENVLSRLSEAAKSVGAQRIAWLQGIHYFLDVELMDALLKWADDAEFDYARCKDGTCKHILGQVLKISALEKVSSLLSKSGEDEQKFYSARPFAFMRSRTDAFKVGLYEGLPKYTDDDLLHIRKVAESVYVEGRALHTSVACATGDVSRGRYLEIFPYMPPKGHVLDIACGTGYGTKILSDRGYTVVGVDIDPDTIKFAQENNSAAGEFRLGNAERIPADTDSFDLAVSIATVEHVPNDCSFIKELARVVKPGGKIILYTPQNRLGKIPIWPHHVREYSAESLKLLVSQYFAVEKVMGWQNGVVTPEDESGDGMYVIAKNAK